MSDSPGASHYATALGAAEERMLDALPDIIDGLIQQAREGDTKAAFYLIDRLMGKAAAAQTALVDAREPECLKPRIVIPSLPVQAGQP